jgi:hypothetical protein
MVSSATLTPATADRNPFNATLILHVHLEDNEHRKPVLCCPLREDLLVEVSKLARKGQGRFDYLLVESTGVSEPLLVA